MTALGLMLEEGRGGRADAPRACSWYRRAAHMGDPSAMLALAAACINGAGVRPSADAALEWIAQVRTPPPPTHTGTHRYRASSQAEEAGAPRPSLEALRRRAEGLAEDAALQRRSLREAGLSGDAATARYMVGEVDEEGGDTARSIQERAREEVDRRATARRRHEREQLRASFEHARSREQRMAEEELGFRAREQGADGGGPAPEQGRPALRRNWRLSIGTDTGTPASGALGGAIATLPRGRPARGGEGTVPGSAHGEEGPSGEAPDAKGPQECEPTTEEAEGGEERCPSTGSWTHGSTTEEAEEEGEDGEGGGEGGSVPTPPGATPSYEEGDTAPDHDGGVSAPSSFSVDASTSSTATPARYRGWGT